MISNQYAIDLRLTRDEVPGFDEYPQRSARPLCWPRSTSSCGP